MSSIVVSSIPPTRVGHINFLTSIDLGVLLGATAEEPGDPEDPGDDGFKFDASMINPLVSFPVFCRILFYKESYCTV